jgi:hypothetical protein
MQPSNIRAEDGTRESYQLAFGKMDNDGNKTIRYADVC